MINIKNLIDDEKCYLTVRQIRWPNGTRCAHNNCDPSHICKRGKDEKQPFRQRYHCNVCDKDFDDLTNTIFAGHHQSLKTWVVCLYFMGLNLSNQQIAKELDLNKDDAQMMTSMLREGVEKRREPVKLSGEVECDEVYVIAGHKGNPTAVKKRVGKGGVTD